MDYKLPLGLKYTPTHEWVREENNLFVTGISDYAQHQLGDIVYIELPELGTIFDKGNVVGEIESVKAVGEFLMPLSGEIIEVNQKLANNPELVNSSPYGDGWFVKIKISDPNELKRLLSLNEYHEVIKEDEK
ncbi:MAG: glycine cleavage system protein GcvH [Promethearchaeota archaeon]